MSKYEQLGYFLEILVVAGVLCNAPIPTIVLCLCGFLLTYLAIKNREADTRTKGSLILYLIAFVVSIINLIHWLYSWIVLM